MKVAFFYGLFMDKASLEDQGLKPANVRLASLPGYQLRIGERATLVRQEGACAYGTVMELEEDELDKLYAGRGVEDYVPVAVKAQLMNGDSIEAVSYVLPLSLLSGSNSEYATELAAIAKRLGLANRYIAEIEAWV